MEILTNKEYEECKIEFLRKTEDWIVETSPMDRNGQYIKTYICSNGDVITEVNRSVFEKVKTAVSVKGVEVEIETEVKLFEHEMFSNKFGSVYTYEKY